LALDRRERPQRHQTSPRSQRPRETSLECWPAIAVHAMDSRKIWNGDALSLWWYQPVPGLPQEVV
jgi:hypothetical protein